MLCGMSWYVAIEGLEIKRYISYYRIVEANAYFQPPWITINRLRLLGPLQSSLNHAVTKKGNKLDYEAYDTWHLSIMTGPGAKSQEWRAEKSRKAASLCYTTQYKILLV
ncbi:Uncharacterized protein HZ326_30598 [Fusarium oxysporum f. sp. albedinis]|nr:Uncharacterized protein HZ326_30598 [Fusarium oxysporum f. sp. albedinis]